MGIVETVMGPRSKFDKGLPYTYEAWVDILDGHGSEPVFDHYFSSTLCGLIDYLDNLGLQPGDVRLYGVYRGRKTRLDSDRCSAGGRWLKRPRLCRALEKIYLETQDDRYRGHREDGPCAFDDRDRTGVGPVW